MMNKILSLIVLVGLIGLLGFSLQGINTETGNTGDPSEESLNYGSAVCIDAVLGGERVHVGCDHNVLTTFGQNTIRDALTGGNTGNFSFIALCNASNTTVNSCAQPVSTDTQLGNEFGLDANKGNCGFNRTEGTKTYDAINGNWSYTYTFTAACDSMTTNVTGIFNNSRTADRASMFAANNFTSVTLQTSDTLAITWYIWVT